MDDEDKVILGLDGVSEIFGKKEIQNLSEKIRNGKN